MELKLTKKILFSVIPLFVGLIFYMYPGHLKWRSINVDHFLPDFLWSFSLFSTLTILEIPGKSLMKRMAIAITLSFLFEFSQLTFIPGTFDFYDLVTYSFGVLLAAVIVKLGYL